MPNSAMLITIFCAPSWYAKSIKNCSLHYRGALPWFRGRFPECDMPKSLACSLHILCLMPYMWHVCVSRHVLHITDIAFGSCHSAGHEHYDMRGVLMNSLIKRLSAHDKNNFINALRSSGSRIFKKVSLSLSRSLSLSVSFSVCVLLLLCLSQSVSRIYYVHVCIFMYSCTRRVS